MKKFTESELYAFISRADSHEKITVAEDFITKLDYLSIDTYDDMMNALAYLRRELYHQERGLR